MTAGANFYIVGRDPAGLPHPDPEVNPQIFRHKIYYLAGSLHSHETNTFCHGLSIIKLKKTFNNVSIYLFIIVVAYAYK